MLYQLTKDCYQNVFAGRLFYCSFWISVMAILTLYGHIKTQSNGPLYSNTMIGTLAVDNNK